MSIRAGTCLLALTAVLASCSSEEPPASLPSLPSPTATSTGTEVKVAPPEDAVAETSSSASAFARFFLVTIGSAFNSADSTSLAAYSAPGCGGCDALIASVDELRKLGHRRVGGEYIDVKAVAPAVIKGDVVVSVSYRRNAGRIVNESGGTVAEAEPVPITPAQMRLVRGDGMWLVQGYRTVD